MRFARLMFRMGFLGFGLVGICLTNPVSSQPANIISLPKDSAKEAIRRFTALADRFGRRGEDWYVAYFFRPRDVVYDATETGRPEAFVTVSDEKAEDFREFVASVDTTGDGRYTQRDEGFDPDWDKEILEKWDWNKDGILSQNDLAPRPNPELLASIRSILQAIPEGEQLYVGWPQTPVWPEDDLEVSIFELERRIEGGTEEKSGPLGEELKRLMAKRSEMLVPRIERGRKLFEERCAGCHGLQGRGDGSAARFIGNDLSGKGSLAPPRDFSLRRFKFQRREVGAMPNDGDLFASIRRGLPGSAMPGWTELTDQQVWDLVHYVKHLVDESYLLENREKLSAEGDGAPSAIDFVPPFLMEWLNPPINPIPDPPPESPELRRIGRYTYLLTQCYTCHGARGNGDGTRGIQADSDGRLIEARNYRTSQQLKGGSTLREIYRTFANGIGGSPMPAHPDDVFVIPNKTPTDFVVPVLTGGGEDEEEEVFFDDEETEDDAEGFDEEDEEESVYEFQLAPGLDQSEIDQVRQYVAGLPTPEKLEEMSKAEKTRWARELRWSLSYYIRSLLPTHSN